MVFVEGSQSPEEEAFELVEEHKFEGRAWGDSEAIGEVASEKTLGAFFLVDLTQDVGAED